MTLSGEVYHVIYFNDDNNYTVMQVLLFEKSFREVVDITHTNIISVCGYMATKPSVTDEFTFEGEFKNNSRYGLQFVFDSCKRAELNNELSIIRYLSSDLFPGIGINTATKIVNKLGVKAIDTILEDKTSLEGLGLSRKQMDSILENIKKDQTNQESILFFLSHGLTMDAASKIINTLGTNAVSDVKEDPYILMYLVSNFGFLKTDKFALSIGIKKDSLLRLKAITLYQLKEIITENGNSYVTYSDLVNLVEGFLKEQDTLFDINNFNKVLEMLQDGRSIYIEHREDLKDDLVFDYRLYREEKTCGKIISQLIKGTRGNPRHFSNNLILHHFQNIKDQKAFKFSEKQEEAIISALQNDIMIITGGPGTGKTTIIKTVLDLYLRLTKKEQDIAVLAPTGRAAKRIKETSGFDAMTIHRYLEYDGKNFAVNKDNPNHEKLVIVDESSMMDLPLFYHLLTGISKNARLIIVGDVDQLPSIGPGQILRDLIESNKIKTIVLDTIHRQSINSSIISLSKSINSGFLPNDLMEKKSDRSIIYAPDDNLINNIKDIVRISIAKKYDILKDIQILIPMYKTDLGIDNINKVIQEEVNPKSSKKYSELIKGDKIYRVHDKIIQLINRPEKGIMNGDIGYITSLNVENDKIIGLAALFDDQKVDYALDELDDINLAYAVTIHKAQGSEFNVVIMPISRKYYPMLKRKLIYTGITRAKEKLIVLGDINMLKMACGRIEERRKTIIKEEIINNLNDSDDTFIFDEPLYQDEIIDMNEQLEKDYQEVTTPDEPEYVGEIEDVNDKNLELTESIGEEEITLNKD